MSVATTPRGGSTPATRAGEAGGRNLAVDGLRGLCALALLFTHVAMIQGMLGTKELGGHIPPANVVGGFLTGGLQIFAGVFFVFTGLFVYRPYVRAVLTGRRRNSEGTVIRRVLRLLPAYYLMFAVVLVTLNLQQVDGVWYVLRPVLLLHVYDWHGWINGMEITWTVPDMMVFYLVVPVFAWAATRYAARASSVRARAYRMLVPIPLMVAIGVGWLLYSQLNGLGTRQLFWWPMGLLPEVGVGMAIAVMVELAKASPADTPRLLTAAGRHPLWFLTGALACLVVNMIKPESQIGMDDFYSLPAVLIFYGLLAVLGFCLTVVAAAPGATDSRFVRALLTNRVIVYLGVVSYGLYLWQFAVLHFLLQDPDAFFGGMPQPIIMLRGLIGFWELQLLTFAITLAVAVASYHLLERPLMNWGERVIARRRARSRRAQPRRRSFAEQPPVHVPL